MNGAPKQEENAAFGSVTPTSVPASFAVKPETKWYMTSAPESRATGGRTPKASAVSSTIVFGCGPRAFGMTLGFAVSGYEKRVFSVVARLVRSSSCGSVCSIFRPGSGGRSR